MIANICVKNIPNLEPMKSVDITSKDMILSIINGKFNTRELVTILELTVNELDILTVSKMARKESKSPNGIKNSNSYYKTVIGGQKMAIKGVKDNNLPF